MEDEHNESKAIGGRARAEKLTPEQRKDIAQKAARAKWQHHQKVAKATHDGTINLGGAEIACAVLADGTRLLSERAVIRAFGGKRGGAHWRRLKNDPDGANLPAYLSAKNITPFIPDDLTAALKNIIPYIPAMGGGISFGLEATLLPQVCDVWLKARDENKILKSQIKMVIAADMLMRSFAKVGIIALIDEATGYQDQRSKDALQQLLAIYLTEEKLRWAKMFPNEFYKNLFRLRGWQYNPLDQRKPKIVGKLTNQIVYKKLPPGVLEKLRELNPVKNKKTWRRGAAFFQYLTADIGQPDLRDHFLQVLPLMRASDDWDSFIRLLNKAIPDPTLSVDDLPLFKKRD
jgi:hypothetical protein